MASQNQQQDESAIEKMNSQLTGAGMKIADNKSIITWVVVGVLVAAGLVFAFIHFYQKPKAEKAFTAYNRVEQTAMGNDSIAAVQYKEVADKFSGKAANLAALSAAESFYNEGNYEEAVKYLKKFSSKDAVLDANAMVLTGDCYVNLKKYDDAISAYQQAVRKADGNSQIVPRVLLKEANVYDEQKKYDKALECYTIIKKDFPDYRLGNGVDIDAYIARENARLGK
ncbi:MAG: tetratricopeptide repeat protein [Bacteroides sp.]|nr:tetratricopeptide repeat protein [Bacteroides sp.]MDE6422855.1 tetratricopeptide repeat protein [Muribaculaceae bacterium]